jgi:hypothetical protein
MHRELDILERLQGTLEALKAQYKTLIKERDLGQAFRVQLNAAGLQHGPRSFSVAKRMGAVLKPCHGRPPIRDRNPGTINVKAARKLDMYSEGGSDPHEGGTRE